VDSIITPVADSCFTIISVPQVETGQEFSIFPNPSRNSFTIHGQLLSGGHLEIFTLRGQKVYDRRLSPGPVELAIDLQGLGDKIFIVKISDSSKVVLVHKQVVLEN
jgi:hypothetical protein